MLLLNDCRIRETEYSYRDFLLFKLLVIRIMVFVLGVSKKDGCSLVGDRSTLKVSKKDSWENQLFKAMNSVQGLDLDSHRCSGKEHVSFFPKMFLLP